MKQWIVKLLGLATNRAKKETNLRCVCSVTEEIVRVDVLETPPADPDFRKETVTGNVRFRLHEFQTARGQRYGVELSIYSRLADRWVLDQFTAGLDLQAATELFDWAADRISGYCWIDDKFVFKGEPQQGRLGCCRQA